ncbi:MAG: peptide chain release factor 1 [Chthonomonadales bacterium]
MSLKNALSKLEELDEKYEQLNAQMLDPGIISDMKIYHQVNKAWSDLTPLINLFREYRKTVQHIEDAEAMVSDSEMRELALADLDELRPKIDELETRLKAMLLPKDPNDDKDVILEIRPAAGGEEAALFAGELLRMYMRYAERRGWKAEILNAQETGIGGFTDVVVGIQGQGAFSQLKYESGVHRVQRVPATESGGRIHTSTATVAVLAEAEEVEVEILANDIEMDIYHASSAGGQNVQKVATAIRIHHKPTNITVTCQDERSQLQNKEKAMRMLRARLLEREIAIAANERSDNRKSQVGTGDRSEKIRTYNFPDGRITDHRVGKTIYNIPATMDGDVQPFIDELAAADQAERLRAEMEQGP